MTLAGKVVVVTGAARGVGAGLARGLAARGARVALLGLEPGELAAVSGQCPGSSWWEVDVTDGPALLTVAADVEDRLGAADVVILNAGIAVGGPLLLADADAYDRVIEVNLLGSIRTARAFLPQVVRTRGYVLQVASVAAMLPLPMMGAYCASKSGAEAFGLALRGELRLHGAAAGVAYLSWTDTDMVRGADAVPGLREMRASIPGVLGRTYPLGPAVEALIDGIERRAPRVYGQRWLRVLNWLRGATPSVLGHLPASRARPIERAILEAGPGATMAVGAGGAADRAARVVTQDREPEGRS